ncbi:MAG: glutamine-hydrolyzing carbamoyl-phosphate synthase small subunit [bacterium]
MKTIDTFTSNSDHNAVLVLSTGSFFIGKGIGCLGKTEGELCFNTGITGYQETLTDPSYAEQLITFTFPHIGNVGTNPDDLEAKNVFCKGLIIREDITNPSNFRSHTHLNNWLITNKVIGISNIDTRALTTLIRKEGPKHACITSVEPGQKIDIKSIHSAIKNKGTLEGQELSQLVTCKKTYTWSEHSFQLGQDGYKTLKKSDLHIVAIDYGIKHNILRCLTDSGAKITVVPAATSATEILSYQPDGVFLSNGPGDPHETAKFSTPIIRELLDKHIPIFGICLGNQLLSIAAKLTTQKMTKGHRGANQPVQDLQSKKVQITSQNHGFCVSQTSVPENIEITHISLFDQSIEGIRFKDRPAFSVQFHPESSPGPHESRHLFEEFIKMIIRHKREKKHAKT